MKMKQSLSHRPSRLARYVALSLGLLLAGGAASSAHAASGTWLATADNLWGNSPNWSATPFPGTGDTATFIYNAPTVNNRTNIDLGTGQAAAAVVFDTTNAAAYTIGVGAVGSQTLTLDNTGAVTLGLAAASAPTTSQLFNASVVLGTAAVGTTTFTNNATAASGVALTFAGGVTGGAGGTAGVKTLNVAGTGATNFTNALSAGGGTVLNLANTGTGNTTLSGTSTSALGTLRATASGTVTVNGQNVTVASSSTYGASSTTFGRFVLTSGSVAFNGGISSGNTADGTVFRVDGGNFSASSVSIGRSSAFTTLPTAASTTVGFIVTGGTANVTGALTLGTSNSSVSGLVSGGSLTVGGAVNLGLTSNGGRYNVLQVSGGTFTSTDATNGILLSPSTTTANLSEFLLTGTGTSTVERIGFGVAASLANSTGTLAMTGGTLYVGSGGIVLGSANAYTATINLTGGILGAKADWSSSLNMNLSGAAGTSFTVQAADAAAVAHNITLSGILGGNGGLTKTGGGTLTLTGANGYSGLTTLNAGALNINGVFALGGANYSGVTFNGGTLQYAAGTGTAFNTTAGGGDITNFGGVKTVTINAGGATVDTNNNNVAYASPLGNGGAGSFTKTGMGVLTFAAANTYTGATVINAGTLTLSSGSVASATVSVTGTGVLTLNNAAAISDLGTLSLVSGTTLNLDGTAGTTETIGALLLNGTAAPAGMYTAAQLAALANSNGITFGSANGETLTVAPVPEPSTWAMVAVGVGLLRAGMNRRRSVA